MGSSLRRAGRWVLELLSSLKLTIVCLALAMIVVFVGTMAQVELGIHAAQARFFQSAFVWLPLGGFSVPVLPGGHLLGAVLLVNLITAHVRRFRLSWSKFGIHIIHGGLILMLVGGLLTDVLSVETQMRLDEGETKNYSEDARFTELVLVDETDPALEEVTAIPEARVRKGGVIEPNSLPFQVVVSEFFQNSRLTRAEPSAPPSPATEGVGAQVAVTRVPPASAQNERNLVSAYIQIVQGGQPLGTWLVSNALGAPQKFAADGKTWRIEMRQRRYYKPYSVTLLDFTHERYPGTTIPKDFSSQLRIVDPDASVNRETLVYMNNPLRYGGETYYQAGFDNNDKTTILQVVRNPGWKIPYISCVLVGIGMIAQFGFHLVNFSRRRTS